MITKEIIYELQQKEALDNTFEDCFCGGGDFGVYRKGNFIYKIAPLDAMEEYDLHPDAEILTDLAPSEYVPKLIHAEKGYVIMSFELGIPLNDFVNELEKEVPNWAKEQIKKAIQQVVEYGYIPYELEPRHVLIDEEKEQVKIIDVTGYSKKTMTEEEKREIINNYWEMFEEEWN